MQRQPLTRLVALATLATGAALGLLGLAGPAAPALAQSQGCGTFTVTPGAWLHTGVRLSKGDRFSTSASGSMWRKPDKSDQWGPGGYYTLGFMAFDLHAKVGDTGKSQDLGVQGEGSADQPGELLLGVALAYEPKPDDARTVHGSFSVTLLRPCAAPAVQPTPTTSPATTPGDDPAVNAFMALLPVLQHPRCANCHGRVDVTDPALGWFSHPGGWFPVVNDELPGGDQCLGCHTDADGKWRQPAPDSPARWGLGTPAQICQALRGGPRTPAELVEHLRTDELVIQGFIGTAAGARPMADPPPLSQTQFVKGVVAWEKAIGATDDDWPADPTKGCPAA
jgi:hypothetical protein